jgi:hypothetical protein
MSVRAGLGGVRLPGPEVGEIETEDFRRDRQVAVFQLGEDGVDQVGVGEPFVIRGVELSTGVFPVPKTTPAPSPGIPSKYV